MTATIETSTAMTTQYRVGEYVARDHDEAVQWLTEVERMVIVAAPVQDVAAAMGAWRSSEVVRHLVPNLNFATSEVSLRGTEEQVGAVLLLLAEAGIGTTVFPR